MKKPPSRKQLDRNPEGEYVVPDPALERLGREIAAFYYQILADKYGIIQRPSPKNAWVWYRAAELAVSHELTALEFTTRQLAQLAPTGAFWPQGMASWKVQARAEQAEPDLYRTQLARYRAQIALYNKLLPLYGAEVYRDDYFPFTPVIRVALAARRGDGKTCAAYRAAAEQELAQYPAARDIKDALLNV